MPLPVENLTPESNPADIKSAIQNSIKLCMKEKEFNGAPPTPARCAAACYSIVKDKTGKDMSY